MVCQVKRAAVNWLFSIETSKQGTSGQHVDLSASLVRNGQDDHLRLPRTNPKVVATDSIACLQQVCQMVPSSAQGFLDPSCAIEIALRESQMQGPTRTLVI